MTVRISLNYGLINFLDYSVNILVRSILLLLFYYYYGNIYLFYNVVGDFIIKGLFYY